MPKIKIAYFDTSAGMEDYSINPTRYGGSSLLGKWAKELLNRDEFDFFIFADEESFRGLGRKRIENNINCIPISRETTTRIKGGEILENHIPGLDYFDMVFHHNVSFKLNFKSKKIKQVMWCPFGKIEDAHPEIDYVLCFRKNQKPITSNQKIFNFTFGTEVNPLKTFHKKEKFIFQCTRHDEQTNSIEVAENCHKNNILGYFAGPIYYDNPNSFLNLMDNKNCFYLGGEISNETKIDFTQKAVLYSFLFKRNPSFNISAIESLACGTPILIPQENLPERTNNNSMFNGDVIPDDQFLKNLIQNNKTGFLYNGSNFKELFELSEKTNPEDCWEAAQNYSAEKMIESLSLILKEIKETA